MVTHVTRGGISEFIRLAADTFDTTPDTAEYAMRQLLVQLLEAGPEAGADCLLDAVPGARDVAFAELLARATLTAHEHARDAGDAGEDHPARAVLPTAGREGVGVIGFCPLAQGIVTDKYLNGIPADSRAAAGKGNGSLPADRITPEVITKVRALNGVAKARGQSLAQMALAWLLKDQRLTSVLIGASKPEQIIDCVGCLAKPTFAEAELAEIERILAT